MKKTFILFLAAVFIFGAQAYCAPLDEIVVYQNNFDKYAKGEDFISGVFGLIGNADVGIEYKPNEGGDGFDFRNKVVRFSSTEGAYTGFDIDITEQPGALTGKFKVSFDVYFAGFKSVRIPEFHGDGVQGFEAIATGGKLGASRKKSDSSYLSTAAQAKHWYNVVIEGDMEAKTFSVSYDGVKVARDGKTDISFDGVLSSKFQSISKLVFKYYSSATGGITYIDNLKIFKYAPVNTNVSDILTSDSFEVTKDTILGVGENTTAEDVLSSLEYSYGTDVNIYTKNNLVREGKLRAGDYLIATNENGETKFTFPDIYFDSLYSDICHIDNEKFDITGIAEGLTADMLLKTIKGKDGLSFSYSDYLGNEKALTEKIKSGDILTAHVGEDASYSYELKKIPHENTIFSDDFDEEYPENWYNESGALRKNSKGVNIQDNALKVTDVDDYQNIAVRYIPEQDGVLVIDQSMIYNYISGTSGATSYIAPTLSSRDYDLGRIITRNTALSYSDYVNTSVTLTSLSRTIENGRKYYQKLVVDIPNNSLSVYHDGDLVLNGKVLSNPMQGLNRLTYTYHNGGRVQDAGNYMLIDDLRVYNPSPVLGAVLYDSENKKIDLVYSELSYEYPNLKESDVTVEDELGNVIETTFSVTDNICTLGLTDKLKDGNYKVTIQDKPHFITVGEAPYEINYAFAQRLSDGANCEISIRNRTLSDKDGEIFAVLFDNQHRLVGVQTAPATILSAKDFETTITIPEGRNPAYVKFFFWNSESDLVPLAKAYIYEFND